jgi:hypothetical protein
MPVGVVEAVASVVAPVVVVEVMGSFFGMGSLKLKPLVGRG